jgi:hypothetical protein
MKKLNWSYKGSNPSGIQWLLSEREKKQNVQGVQGILSTNPLGSTVSNGVPYHSFSSRGIRCHT